MGFVTRNKFLFVKVFSKFPHLSIQVWSSMSRKYLTLYFLNLFLDKLFSCNLPLCFELSGFSSLMLTRLKKNNKVT